MKPFPKWFGVFSGIMALAPTLYAAYEAGGIKGAIFALLGVLGSGGAVVSHSLTGKGGKTDAVLSD